MPAADSDLEDDPKLPFPPVKTSHILHCSIHYWHPRYRALTPKARLIKLSPAFVAYLHADGIQLPPEGESEDNDEFESDIASLSKRTAGKPSTDDSDDAESDEEAEATESDPSLEWPETHSAITSTIAELGGKVVPKLNWSAPKDATWINATNSMECRTPNDIYLLLKSSDFVTHDLEHAFDGCASDDEDEDETSVTRGSSDATVGSRENALGIPLPKSRPEVPYTLCLRKAFALNPAVEFRCFARRRNLLAICQRSVNHFDFLFPLAPKLRSLVSDFFDKHIRDSFPDENFVFDVYVPNPYTRVWLIDFNPWAPRTDPLLFSWLELLTMDGPPEGNETDATGTDEVVRVRIENISLEDEIGATLQVGDNRVGDDEARGEGEAHEKADEELFQPELRLIRKDDPEAYSFNTPQYSAHKLPKDVVEASQSGEGPLMEFTQQWKELLDRGERQRQS